LGIASFKGFKFWQSRSRIRGLLITDVFLLTSVVALEAEYIACSDATREAFWFRQAMKDMYLEDSDGQSTQRRSSHLLGSRLASTGGHLAPKGSRLAPKVGYLLLLAGRLAPKGGHLLGGRMQPSLVNRRYSLDHSRSDWIT